MFSVMRGDVVDFVDGHACVQGFNGIMHKKEK